MMKRSIISLCVFLFLIISILFSEWTYLQTLANKMEQYTDSYAGFEDAVKLEEIFKKYEWANRMFLRDDMIEKFEVYIKELKYYTEEKSETQINCTLEKLGIYINELKHGRAF